MGMAPVNDKGQRIWQCDICNSTWPAPGGECAECNQKERDRFKGMLVRYAVHVLHHEGTDFLNTVFHGEEAPGGLTKDEIEEIRVLVKTK